MKKIVTLRHVYLPGLTPYLRASAIQDRLVRAHLDHKASQSLSAPPRPCLLTFEAPPTYTCGRREIGTLSDSQIEHLRAGGSAEFHEALRGGQTTFHGPGQLTAYLILSLQEHGLNTRSHVKLLEDSVIGTCQTYGINASTTENPGVWIGTSQEERKLASVGVHLRRHIASHGIGLNVLTDLSWFDRIVACGLVGKHATSIEKELKALHGEKGWSQELARFSSASASGRLLEFDDNAADVAAPIPLSRVADIFARNVATRLNGVHSKDVQRVSEDDVLARGAQGLTG